MSAATTIAPNGVATSLPWADAEMLATVRPEVRQLLVSSEAFRKLPADEQRDIASTMVKVAAYMADPDGVARETLTETAPLARAQEGGGVSGAKDRAGKDPGFAGSQFEAGAIKQGVKQFGELVKKVDFPRFVSGLIQNVFQAIVDSSIEQMRAYGELLANVAKTVDQFARDNITDNNARDWLAQSFPGELGIDTSSMGSSFAEGEAPPTVTPKLAATTDDTTELLKKLNEQFAMSKPLTDLSDEAQERMLVQSAKLQIAKGRQQLLASMVVLGINRIVVTDGLIHAKVLFDLTASDRAKRDSKASLYDEQKTHAGTKASVGYGAWFSPVKASMTAEASTDHITTVQSSVDETSESKAEVKAKLSGEVRVNFKSDYFPMEKLASPQMIAAIQGNAIPPEKPVENA
jgi:hypothetical protein